MESVVQCPVCTLFLHPGMSLEDHLNTHPKDQVIQALSQLTLQRANILSGTQFSPAKSVSPTPTTPTTVQQQNSNHSISGVPSNGTEVNGNQFSCGFAPSNNNNRKETALLIQVQSPTTPMLGSGPSSSNNNNNNTSARTSPQLFNHNYHDSTPKNLMIVNQYVQQRIGPSSPPKRTSSQQIAIAYTDGQPTSLIPRYTSERYSGPPPPYSTAISSTSFNNFTSIARDHYMTTGGNSNESSSSSYEVKAHYMEKEDGNFLVTESPQKIVEYSEDENGVLTLSEKVIKSPPRLVPCSRGNTDDEGSGSDERMENVSEAIAAETLYASEPILVEKVEKMTVEAMDEVTHTTTTNKSKKKTTNGLKVLSNVKITTDMISPGLQEILLNNNRKGRRINKILNTRPQQSDLHSPSPPPVMMHRSPQPSTSNHCDDEVMDLTQASHAMDLHAPSTSRKHEQKYEMESYVEEQFQITDMSSEDAIEQAEIMGHESFHDDDEHDEAYDEEPRNHAHEDEDEDYMHPETPMSPPPLSSTPTSVIRTITDVTSPSEPTINIKSEKPLILEALPPSLIMSPKPSTSSQDSHLNANHQKSMQIGKPILQKPKKLTLKLKKTIPCQNSTNDTSLQPKIKVEPDLNVSRETHDEPESLVEQTTTNVLVHPAVKVEKIDTSFDQKPTVPHKPLDDTPVHDDNSNSHDNNAEAGPSHPPSDTQNTLSSSFTITYMGDEDGTGTGVCEEETAGVDPSTEIDNEMYIRMYIPQTDPNAVPLSWVQRFSPQYVPFDERSSYMEIDGSYSKNSNSVSLTSEGDTRNGQSSNSFDERAPSADSCLNIRTDEKMPAKGEISEQESNGEIDNWNQVYQDPIQQYPSSYDVSTAQECWNLSNNKPEFMQQQQQYATL